MPIIALMVSISCFGMMARMPFSTCATSSSVRSMREPTGARKCSFIRPASTEGKKSVPTTKTRPKLATAMAAAAAMVKRRWCRAASRMAA